MMTHLPADVGSIANASPDNFFNACAELIKSRYGTVSWESADRLPQAELDQAEQLEALLAQLKVDANPITMRCFGRFPGATAHAIKNLRTWMSYLPHDCISSMVRDGWHWST